MYTDREKAAKFAMRQKKSPTVKRTRVSQISQEQFTVTETAIPVFQSNFVRCRVAIRGCGVLLRLLVADDNEVLRMGVRSLIGARRGWQVCGEAANGEEAIAKVRELAPDVIILDLTMPVMNGFQVAAKIRRIAPSTKIVFFSVHEVPASAKEAGADEFVSKADAAQELITAIERVTSPPEKVRSKAQSA